VDIILMGGPGDYRAFFVFNFSVKQAKGKIFRNKTRTGGSRPARRHTFARQQKYAKVPAPRGGHAYANFSVIY
jgi:hypothetical protein